MSILQKNDINLYELIKQEREELNRELVEYYYHPSRMTPEKIFAMTD